MVPNRWLLSQTLSQTQMVSNIQNLCPNMDHPVEVPETTVSKPQSPCETLICSACSAFSHFVSPTLISYWVHNCWNLIFVACKGVNF